MIQFNKLNYAKMKNQSGVVELWCSVGKHFVIHFVSFQKQEQNEGEDIVIYDMHCLSCNNKQKINAPIEKWNKLSKELLELE